MAWIWWHANFWLRSRLGVSPSCSREWPQCSLVGERRPIHHHGKRRITMAFGNGAISNCPLLSFITYALFTPLPPLSQIPRTQRFSKQQNIRKKENLKGENYIHNVTGHPHCSMIDWRVYGSTILTFDPDLNPRLQKQVLSNLTCSSWWSTSRSWWNLVKFLVFLFSSLTKLFITVDRHAVNLYVMMELQTEQNFRSWMTIMSRQAWEDNIKINLSNMSCLLNSAYWGLVLKY